MQVVPSGKGGVILPKRMELRWPEQSLKMGMTMSRVTLNQPPARPDLLFVRRPMTNVPSLDLAQLPGNGGVQRTGGTQ